MSDLQSGVWNRLPVLSVQLVLSYLTSSTDRLNVSAVCRHWRTCLYHNSVWPVRRLVIDLQHIADDRMQTTARKALDRPHRDRHCLCHSAIFPGLLCIYCVSYRVWLLRCGRFLNTIVVRFQADNVRHVRQLNDTLQLLSCDRPHEPDHSESLLTATKSSDHKCRNRMQHVWLQPLSCESKSMSTLHSEPHDCDIRQSDSYLLQSFADTWLAIERLLFNSRRPTQLSIGCLESMLPGLPAFLNRCNRLPNCQHIASSLQSLHVSSVKIDPHFYWVHCIPDTSFAAFCNLRSLSIDYDMMHSALVRSLAKNCLELRDLSLHVHGLDSQHEIIGRRVWDLFQQRPNAIPPPDVSVHLLNTHDQPIYLLRLLRNLSLPLVRLSAYFVIGRSNRSWARSTESISVNRSRAYRYRYRYRSMLRINRGHSCVERLLELLGTQHQNSLRELRLVEKPLRYEFACPYATFSSMHENALVMLAWRCRLLEKLTVIGFEVSELDLLAIARLRGNCLKELLVPEHCISLLKIKLDEDESLNGEEKVYLHKVSAALKAQVVQRIAQPLKRDWNPITNRQTEQAILPTDFYFDTLQNSDLHFES